MPLRNWHLPDMRWDLLWHYHLPGELMTPDRSLKPVSVLKCGGEKERERVRVMLAFSTGLFVRGLESVTI